jgi:hypothetical protein
MIRKLGFIFGFVVSSFVICHSSFAAPPVFPPHGSEKSVHGELVSADFIHRSGQFRTASGELMSFTMPPPAIMTYLGTESDLRDVPLGTKMEFLLVADEDGRFTRLVGTKHGNAPDEAQRKRFIEFTKARGLAGWVEQTSGNTLTVTFFSGAPNEFAKTWGEDFSKGKDVRVSVANDELRTWNAKTVAERATILEMQNVPVSGHGCSGRRVVIQAAHMLEGFRQGRVVRVFGSGWAVKDQSFGECLINYGYSHVPAPDFIECMAKHYPEQFPYRTEHGNRHLPWFKIKEGSPLPSHSEHLVFGQLTSVDDAAQNGEFKTELAGEKARFTMINTGAKQPGIRFQAQGMEGAKAKLKDLALGQRYRFHMYQDAKGNFTLCSFISDDYSHLVLNSCNYQIQRLDPEMGRIEVTWQRLPVKNYNGDMETPPPFGHSILRIAPETRIWKGNEPSSLTNLKAGDLLRINLTAEFPGKPAHCTDLWLIDLSDIGKKPRK